VVPEEGVSRDDDGRGLAEEWCLHHFDHLSEELAQDLPGVMARMRRLCPVARSEEHGGFWVVSSYDEALAVAQDWATYSSAHGLSVTANPGLIRNLPVEADPPEQYIYKRLVSPFFTPSAVARWESGTRGLVNELIDSLADAEGSAGGNGAGEDSADGGRAEFMDAFARPLPSRAFFQFAINAPAQDLDRVCYLASKSSTPKDPLARECWAGLHQWVRDFVAARRAQPPRGDVVDAVIAADIGGRPIADDEIAGTVQLLILGGLETTAGALGLAMVRLCRDRELQRTLRGNPRLIAAAVEESLRIDPSFVSVGRTAIKDAELAGRAISSGDKVLIHWASANRDAGEFTGPDAFDLARERNRHLAFGAGPHRCVGSSLARMNMRIALEELLRRLDDIRLDGTRLPGGDATGIRYHAGLTRSPLSVPITFSRRRG
jgi:cytochrome P450